MIRGILRFFPDVRTFEAHPMSGGVQPGLTRAMQDVQRPVRDTAAPEVDATDLFASSRWALAKVVTEATRGAADLRARVPDEWS